MAQSTGKRPRATLVKQDVVQQARGFLESLPEKPKDDFSVREAVDHLREELQAALARGYSYQDLAQILNGKGIKITVSTLKNYIPSGKRQATKDKATKAPRRTSRSEATAPAPEPEASTNGKGSVESVAEIPLLETVLPTPPEPAAAPVEAEPAAATKAPRKRSTTAKAPANSAAKTTTKKSVTAAKPAGRRRKQTEV